ncbi:MAG: dTMP kinase [Chlorobi bacterium]|nr:MAG: dTMP kinase [Bacteroidota bacterium]KXK34382.1 MAG: thymidylate kinase [Chlorobi bacterium OLB6]MBE2265333.1 dTMP kinase [Flavobacteriales bacterium]MBL1160204.1 dTMP kinase [Chlorobiota bacterium]MBW7853342.1 dTMP kinase [Candidatus Kapabacteria bacterium]MCC6331682.1 dTMP kinase [Ignavibacteria bacterium]
MFISFEGIDGSGKSTQLILLREWLQERGYKVVSVREPGATALSEDIRAILLSNARQITNTAELLLFSAARAQLVERVIVPELEAGSFVLCDRFADSTTAYQGYGRQLSLTDVDVCNRVATRGVKPEITYFIDVPYAEAQTRMQFHADAGEPDRMERSGAAFFERVRTGYLELARQEPKRFVLINGMLERTQIHHEIIQHLKPYLQNIKKPV